MYFGGHRFLQYTDTLLNSVKALTPANVVTLDK